MGDWASERWLGDAPHFPRAIAPTGPQEPLPCGACGSDDTECVHAWAAGSIIGYVRQLEVRCRACGRYTALEETYDS